MAAAPAAADSAATPTSGYWPGSSIAPSWVASRNGSHSAWVRLTGRRNARAKSKAAAVASAMLSQPAVVPWSTSAVSESSNTQAATTPSASRPPLAARSGSLVRRRRIAGTWTTAARMPAAESHAQIA